MVEGTETEIVLTMAAPLVWLGGLSLLVWLYLLAFHHRFWRADQKLPPETQRLETWPRVTAIVPARDEAGVIAQTLGALAAQDYPGPFSIIVVDDSSSDGTAAVAREVARTSSVALRVLAGKPLADGWTGKVWALNQGVAEAGREFSDGGYLWFTDADVEHAPGTLARLVAKARSEGRDLVSLMVKLHCSGFWERHIVPAFVFFFQKLYPFPAINDPAKEVAAAAGGCVLIKRSALRRAGGLAAIRGALIDDCALARAVRDSGGALWLGLGEQSRSIRPYRTLGALWDMIARGAYTQLRHSPPLLLGALAAMALTYLAPPALSLGLAWHGDPVAAALGALAWLVMTAIYVPTLDYYRQPVWTALFLPLVAAIYMMMTADSALRHWRGHGGAWKKRYADSRMPSQKQ